ncbi:aspartate/glutamate racemase family protein [Paraburkholderia caribensis]|uniref:Aspartate/glutamate racemase family protein n=1 Tax=Paraburkholderia caribensis TaxID=75105 RepID=A0A9Q6S6Y9_9BURK|nr:aspartate/glutamate racemase family protein [Paraburkholderia caribensis]MCO4878274.1 aspartate/glutamate racemase family protein [Paraburkholderia caribensis]PTB28625.1 hydantoin racemase [Paraburkholderia caribensis]QLB66072.1 hydantoin racemase [Paraburkholderia caribensis]
MTIKIKFINPFGTPLYNDLITETLTPYLRNGSELAVANTTGCPENIDYYYSKHLIEVAVFEEVIKAESEGFDAAIVGCCYDPGVRVARELVDIPVVGPLEATMQYAPYYGHDYVLVTDHHKAVPYLRDLVRLYGEDVNCRDVSSINWFVSDMIKDTDSVAADAIKAAERAMLDRGAEAAILGCTIISASYERWVRQSGEKRNLAILNPNIFALKMAESLADLKKQGAYQISRRGYYQQLQQHNPREYAELRERFMLKSD